MKKNIFKVTLSLLLLIVLPLQAGSLSEMADPYRRVLSKNTQQGSKHNLQQLNTQFRWFATHLSQDFLAAQAKKHQKHYPQADNPLVEKLKKQLDASPLAQVSFVVGLYAKDRKLKRLNQEDHYWEISLSQGSQVYLPKSVESLSRNPYYQSFFPYLKDKWYQAYLVTFEGVEPSQKSMKLSLSSVAGLSELKF